MFGDVVSVIDALPKLRLSLFQAKPKTVPFIMADIKTEKPQPEVSDAADTAEAYTEKVTLYEHDLELEQALANYVPDSPEEKALVRKLDLYMVRLFFPPPPGSSAGLNSSRNPSQQWRDANAHGRGRRCGSCTF